MATHSFPLSNPIPVAPAASSLGTPRKPPGYRRHSSGQARVTVDGTDHYLGVFGTPASWEAYHRIVTEWLSHGFVKLTPAARASLTIVELCAAYWEHAESYYRDSTGRPTSEIDNYRQAMRPLRKLFDLTAAKDFGPNDLRTVRDEMLRMEWSRSNINKQIARLKHLFKWGASHELLPASAWHALQTVEGLRRGRSSARESEPIRPVPEELINAIRPFVSRQVWAIVQLQLFTGARAGELVALRGVDIDTIGGEVWAYRPRDHKTSHHGHKRTIYFGPRAQAILREFLTNRPLDAYLFSAAEAETERLAEAHRQRKTPLSCGNVPGSNRVEAPTLKPGLHYDTSSYRRAIARACERAADSTFPPPSELTAHERKDWRQRHRDVYRWHPHRLRHSAATYLRREFGIEVAQIVLGHRLGSCITEVYAEANADKAMLAIQKVG